MFLQNDLAIVRFVSVANRRKGLGMNMSKRIMCLLLVALMAVSVLVGCANTNDSNKPGESGTSAGQETQGEEEAKFEVPDNLNYEDKDFVVLTCPGENEATKLYWTHFGVTDETGDTLNDGIYKANRNTESYLHIKLVSDESAGLIDTSVYRNNVAANDDSFQLACWIDRFALELAMDGLVTAVNQLDADSYVDLSKPWWYKTMNDTLSIDHKLYLAAGYMGIDLFGGMQLLLYNKQIAADTKLGPKEDGNLYPMVYDGTWTMEAMYQMMVAASKELDGDGNRTEADQWGVVSTGSIWFNNFSAVNGATMIEKDKDDMPVFSAIGNERLYNIWNYVIENLTNDEYNFDEADGSAYGKGHTYENVIYMFLDNKALFAGTTPMYLEMLNGFETDYGILPFPKYEAAEPGTPYNSYTTGLVAHFAPISITNTDMVAATMETLNYQYYKITIPAYVNKVLSVRQVRDDDSAEILDMMIKNRSLELGQTYWFDACVGGAANTIWTKGINVYTSTFQKNQSKIEKAIERTVDAFDKLS